jgi:hypothetical protein
MARALILDFLKGREGPKIIARWNTVFHREDYTRKVIMETEFSQQLVGDCQPKFYYHLMGALKTFYLINSENYKSFRN